MLVAVLCISFGAYVNFFNLAEARIGYRLEVILEFDGEPRTFSTVQELIVAETSPMFTSAAPVSQQFYGQALVMQLDGLDTIVVPMMVIGGAGRADAVGYSGLFIEACGLGDKSLKQSYADYIESLSQFVGRCKVPERAQPFFIRFPELANPDDIHYVDPSRMAETFSSRVRLIGMFVETTDQRVSNDIESQLPWLARLNVTDNGRFILVDRGAEQIPLSENVFDRRP